MTDITEHFQLYKKKLQILKKLIINEYGEGPCDDKLDLEIAGFSDLTNFQVEICNELWGDFKIIIKVDIRFTWKKLKAKIEEGILKGKGMEAGTAGRCPCCYDDLKDVEAIIGCAVCNAIVCSDCINKMRRDKGAHKCPLCRTKAVWH